MYNYDYDSWGVYNGFGYGANYGNGVRGTDDNCAACAGGKIGCGWTTYHNNELYGSCSRTVKFIRIEKRCICGEDVDVLIPDMEFFDRFRYDCRKCANFFAEICA